MSRSAEEQRDPTLWSYLKLALSAALLLLVVALGAAVIVVPAMTHSVPLTVLTNSMRPKLPPGTLLIVRPVDPADVRIGDVITYQIESGKPDVITHRVIGIGTNSKGELTFIMQGDNNPAPDADPVREVQVQGRLWYAVPFVGWVNNTVPGHTRSKLIPIVAGALLLYAAWAIGSGVVENRRKKAAELEGAEADEPTEPEDD